MEKLERKRAAKSDEAAEGAPAPAPARVAHHDGANITFAPDHRGGPQRHCALARGVPSELSDNDLCKLVRAHLGVTVSVGHAPPRSMPGGLREVELACGSARDEARLLEAAPIHIADLSKLVAGTGLASSLNESAYSEASELTSER